MDLKTKVKRAIRELGLADLKVALERTPTGRLSGIITSSSFQDRSQLDRQDQIWGQLQKRLTKDEQAQVVSLITVTPLENADVAA